MRFAVTSARRLALAPRSTSAMPRMVLRGMAGSSVHGEDPDRIAREKARNLKGEQDSSAPHKEHAPGWNEHLASESEANVKADQATPKGPPSKDLQDKTIKQTHEHHHGEGGSRGAPPSSGSGEPTHSEESVRAEQGKPHKH